MATGHTETDEMPKRLDGPLLLSPDSIHEQFNCDDGSGLHPPDISIEGYRPLWKSKQEELMKQRDRKREDFQILEEVVEYPMIDMHSAQGQPDEKISRAVERHYVGAKMYV
jgi:hypothetical protein